MTSGNTNLINKNTCEEPTPCPSLLELSLKQAWQRIIPFSLVFLTGCFILFVNLGKYPLFNPDEALYAEPAREMLDTGEYITTLLNYKIRFTKPPLVIWAMAACYKIFAVNEFAARFFGAACGALVLAFTYLFFEKYANRKIAIMSSLMLATAPLFVGVGREAITDMPLTLFCAGSLMSFFHAYQQKSNKWLYLAYALFRLAVITKGPIGVLLPILIMAAFHIPQGNIKKTLAFYKPIHGAFIIGAIAIPWFAIEIAITKGAYYQEFLVRENFQRFTSVVDSHKGGWWYHIVAMLGGFLPWSAFSVTGLITVLFYGQKIYTPHNLRQTIKTINPAKYWQQSIAIWDTHKQLVIFSSLWVIITLGFFSASVSKLLPYTLPAFPALAFLTALYLNKICEGERINNLIFPYLALALAFAGIYSFAPLIAVKAKGFPAGELLTTIKGFTSFELITILLSIGLTLVRKPFTSLFIYFILTTSCTLYFANRTINSLAYHWEEPLTHFARYAGQSNWPIFVYDMRKPSVPFYSLRQVILPGGREDLHLQLQQMPQAYILTKVSNKDYFATSPGCKILAAKGNYLLIAWQPNLKATSD